MNALSIDVRMLLCYVLLVATRNFGDAGRYNMLPTNDQDAVMQHIAEVGPLAVSVYAR